MSKGKSIVSDIDKFQALLGFKTPSKAPEVEVYRGQEFLFSTNKKSNKPQPQPTTEKKPTIKQQKIVVPVQTINSVLRLPRIELKRKRIARKSHKFSLTPLKSLVSRTSKRKSLNWFDRLEGKYCPLLTSDLMLMDIGRVGKLNLDFRTFKRQWQSALDVKMQQAAIKRLTRATLETHYVKKAPTIFDKLFNYYEVKVARNMYAHKAFIALEMQINSMLVKTRLVPYQHMVEPLCFYDLVRVNGQTVRDSHYVLGLYDTLSVPVHLHNYMHVRDNRILNYPYYIRKFFKKYWKHTVNFNTNKLWLLSNFVKSDVTAEAIIFDYPNILLYMAPFSRFTKMYYESNALPPTGPRREWLNYTHTVLKLKLFEFASYYK